MEKVNDIFIERNKYKAGSEFNYLFLFDVHYDSIACDRQTLKRVLDEAKEKNAKIIFGGDFFDVMGGKFDKRTKKSDIRPEYNVGSYFTDIKKDAKKFLLPYKDQIVLMILGNHEESINQRHEFDLLGDFIETLNPSILYGDYDGFIKFMFSYDGKEGGRLSKLMYYTHGSGGNAPVTNGAIQSARRQDTVDADMYISGHIHTEYQMPRTMFKVTEGHKIITQKKYHWQVGTFKLTHGVWSKMKGHKAANIGGLWVTFKAVHNATLDRYDLKIIGQIAD